MSDVQRDLIHTIDRICEQHCTRALRESAERGEWPAALWDAFDAVGIVRAALPESEGGPGLEFADVAAALRRSAYHAVPLPLAETMLAGRLLVAAGLPVPEGALTVAPVAGSGPMRVRRGATQSFVTGEARRVPWADACSHLVVVAGEADACIVGLAASAGLPMSTDRNLAGEPRVTVRFDDTPLEAAAPLSDAAVRLHEEGALLRSVQMTGALERALAHALQYANERVQFGRAIGKFQAIQHMLAVMAGHVAASAAITDAAVEASGDTPHAFAIAAAKARVGEAAGCGAEIAHQVHGAMGYTHEHGLHYTTRRLWSWRDEFGNEAEWQMRLGREVARLGPQALWPRVTAL